MWIDHTGRGAVEITECGGDAVRPRRLAEGHAKNETCGKQMIGNVKPVGGDKWDNGWIYDLDEDPATMSSSRPMGR